MGRLDAARPRIGTDIAVLLLIWAEQRLCADRARDTFAPQKGLPAVLTLVTIELFILRISTAMAAAECAFVATSNATRVNKADQILIMSQSGTLDKL
jgi:hypothetical protein